MFDDSTDRSGLDTVGVGEVSARVHGLSAGIAFRPAPDALVGVSLAKGSTRFDTANRVSGHSDVDQLGVSSNPDVGAAFQTVPDGSFSVAGIAPVRDLALLSADATLRLKAICRSA